MKNIRELKTKKLTWIDITSASQENLKYLKSEFGFDSEDLNDCLPTLNRQKIHPRDKYTFFVLQFPYYDRSTNTIRPAEIDVFLNKKFIITIHDENLRPIIDLFNLCQTDQLMKSQIENIDSLSLFYRITHKLYNYCYPILNHVNNDIESIEDDVIDIPEEQTVINILKIKRNIVTLQKMMQSHRGIWQKFFEILTKTKAREEVFNNFHNLLGHTKDIWDYLSNYKDTINALQETQESITSIKINDIMKTLTIFSVIVFPLTLLAAIFGMNTFGGMPFLNHPYGFWIVIIVMAIGMVVMFWYFKKKKWM